MTYKVVRVFFQKDLKKTLATGLTLEQAQEHCSDPETSSKTCTKPNNKKLTKEQGPWFDAYYKED